MEASVRGVLEKINDSTWGAPVNMGMPINTPGDDIYFNKQEFIGAVPKYSGIMGIDATWKGGYQKTLEMQDDIINKVNEKWEIYWK